FQAEDGIRDFHVTGLQTCALPILKSGLDGSMYIMLILVPLSFILGVGAAIYLEEYAPKNKLTRLIQLNISTLAGVPSIVYGILGLALFVRMLSFQKSLISGALTMTLLVLPIITVATQERSEEHTSE